MYELNQFVKVYFKLFYCNFTFNNNYILFIKACGNPPPKMPSVTASAAVEHTNLSEIE